MQRTLLIAAGALIVGLTTAPADAGHPSVFQRMSADRAAYWYNTNQSWHRPYQHVQWGHPVALIVPPTASFQTEYSWGVARTRMVPIHHQFGRPIARRGGGGGGTMPTPPWPWTTEQIGVYSVRGPW